MTSKTIARVIQATLTLETLEETPQRALKFLRGAGTSLAIRSALATRGYSADDHREGWGYLHDASGYLPSDPIDTLDHDVRDAIRELDAWDEDGFRLVRASLERRYPAVAAKVLDGLGPSVGTAAVLGVRSLLERLDRLEKSKSKDDREAVVLLAKRGLDLMERRRLWGLVRVAQTIPESAEVRAVEASASRKASQDAHVASLVALRAWYEEWSNIARTCIKRRDHLILLGLAKRKSPARGDAPAPAPAPPSDAS
jgi:hypothetical protein